MAVIGRCVICEQPITEGVVEPDWTTGGTICFQCAHSLAVAALKSAREQLQGAAKALEAIRERAGKVCPIYEVCEHESCQASYTAWALADEYLRGQS